MILKNVALVLRKSIDGKVLIVGSSLDIPLELIDDQEHLFLGEIEIRPKHLFYGYKFDKGNSPNDLLSDRNGPGGALNWKNYERKIEL